MNKSVFISPFFVGALLTPSVTASIYADLSARTVTGINDGSGVVRITNGTELVGLLTQQQNHPQGQRICRLEQRRVLQ